MKTPTIAPNNAKSLASFFAIALIGAIVYGWVGWHARTVFSFSDSMDYLMMADFYREVLRGGDPMDAVWHYRATRFPPLFPLVIGAVGGGSGHQHAATLISLFFSATSPLMVWLWVSRATGSTAAANTIAIALLLYPVYFLLSLMPVSEPFAIALFALAFWLTAGRPPSSSAWLVAAMIIGVSLLARTALLPLAIALLIIAAVHRVGFQRFFILAIAAFGPYAIWAAYRRTIGAHAYSASLNRDLLLEHLPPWPNIVWEAPWSLFVGLARNWGIEPTLSTWLLTGILASLAVVGLLIRLRRWQLDAWFLAGYMAMIMIWPYPTELGRFLIFVFPVILVSAWEGSSALIQKVSLTKIPTWAPIAFLTFAAGAPASIQYLQRAATPIPYDLLDEKREPFFFVDEKDTLHENAEIFHRSRLLAMELPKHVPLGECVYAVMPQIVELYARIPSTAYPHDIGTSAEAKERLTECRYFYLTGVALPAYDVPSLYPALSLMEWTKPVLISELKDRRTAAALLVREDQSTKPGARKLTNYREDQQGKR